MKKKTKKKFMVGSLVLGSSMLMTGCFFDPSAQMETIMYGVAPPTETTKEIIDKEKTKEKEKTQSYIEKELIDQTPVAMYGVVDDEKYKPNIEDYNPEEDTPVDMYGVINP